MLAFTDPELTFIGEGIKLNDWLSFVGAMFGAIATVTAAIYAARLQLEKQEQAQLHQRQRELLAARAILANDLSAIIDYLQDCGSVARAMMNRLTAGILPHSKVSAPTLPTDILLRLSQLVSLAAPADGDVIAGLMSDLQLVKARLGHQVNQFSGRGDPHLRQDPSHLRSALTSIIHVYILCAATFEYARRRTDHIDTLDYSEKAVNSALLELGLKDIDPGIVERIKAEVDLRRA